MLSYVIAIPEFNKLTNFSFDSRMKKKNIKEPCEKKWNKRCTQFRRQNTENSENYFSDKSHFEDNATQNYWVF